MPNSGSTRCVGDDGHAALDDRDDDLASDRVAVPLVVGMHRDRDVGEDRRRAHRRDRDPLRAVAVRERVEHVEERVVHLDVLDLEIRDRRLVVRAPVDDAVRAVDPARLPEPDEERHHRLDVRVVHREPLARVVERRAEAAVLAHDRPPRRGEPAPRPLEEGVAPDLLARRALRDELLLDHVLGRDPGVVVAGLPERVEAAHPVPADEHVLDRAVESVPHVELARDVRRRDADDEACRRAARRRPRRTAPRPPTSPASAARRRTGRTPIPSGDGVYGASSGRCPRTRSVLVPCA